MIDLAIFLRFKQLLAHSAHNMINGSTFFADHQFLGEMYKQAEEQYDSVIERIIGLNVVELNIPDVQARAVDYLINASIDTKNVFQCFQGLYNVEKDIVTAIDVLCEGQGVSEGTRQLIGEIANQAEINLYKIGQRLKLEA